MERGISSWAKLACVVGFATATVACGHGGMQNPNAPGAGPNGGGLKVSRLQSPEDAPEHAKTIQVEYAFKKDLINKDFEKTFKDGFDKKGVKVDETVVAKTHFDVKEAKITGTVTYVKKGFAHYSIVEADLVATGHYDADVQIDLDVNASGDTTKAKDELGKTILGGKPIPLIKNVAPTNIPIAGPLFLHAHFDLSAACEFGAEGNMHATTGVGISGDVRLAAKYKKAGIDKGDGKKHKFAFEAKTPNFELAPKPYLNVEGKQQKVHGKCSLQPTAVLLMEKMIGAKLSVEPYVEVDAQRPNAKAKWQIDAQAGVEVSAATDMQFFGRQIGKPKEFKLYEVALFKKGDALSAPPAARKPGAPSEIDNSPTPPPAEMAVASNDKPEEKPETASSPASDNTKPAEPPKTASDATATADTKTETAKAEPAKEETAKAEPAKEEKTAAAETAKEEPAPAAKPEKKKRGGAGPGAPVSRKPGGAGLPKLKKRK